jgi:hypothetical protein
MSGFQLERPPVQFRRATSGILLLPLRHRQVELALTDVAPGADDVRNDVDLKIDRQMRAHVLPSEKLPSEKSRRRNKRIILTQESRTKNITRLRCPIRRR